MKLNYDDKFYRSIDERGKKAAQETALLLSKFLNPQYISDIGCGSGTWTNVYSRFFPKANIRSWDLPTSGIVSNKEITGKKNVNFTAINFETDSLEHFPETDLTICLEVLEHITPKRADILIDAIADTSKHVLFSAATPGQGGTHHINERPLEYWIKKLRDREMVMFDIIRPRLTSPEIPSYYRNNIVFFTKRDSLSELANLQFLEIVSNEQIADYRSVSERALSQILKRFPHSLVTQIARLK